MCAQGFDYSCLTLLLPTGFGHMTVHFSGGAHDLPTMHLAETDW